jgi:hypothetical protein
VSRPEGSNPVRVVGPSPPLRPRRVRGVRGPAAPGRPGNRSFVGEPPSDTLEPRPPQNRFWSDGRPGSGATGRAQWQAPVRRPARPRAATRVGCVCPGSTRPSLASTCRSRGGGRRRTGAAADNAPQPGGHLTAPATVVVLGRVARFPTHRPVMSDIGLVLAVGGVGEETSPGLFPQARQCGAPRRARASRRGRRAGRGPTADAGTRRSGIDASVHGPVLGYWLTTEEGPAQTPIDRQARRLARRETVRCSQGPRGQWPPFAIAASCGPPAVTSRR